MGRSVAGVSGGLPAGHPLAHHASHLVLRNRSRPGGAGAGAASWSMADVARVAPGLGGDGLGGTPPSSDNEGEARGDGEWGGGGDKRAEEKESFQDKRARAIADWDPSYRDEKVDWYKEYVARHAVPSVSWLEQPGEGRGELRKEIRGVGYLKDGEGRGEDMIVGPLEDGSLCVWDLRSSSGARKYVPEQRGRMIGQSRKGLLFASGDDHDDLTGSPGFVGVDECVSVDAARRRVYVAVHNTLNEVDVETLQVVSQERYPWFISALSDATYPTPLTVGTTLSLHLHDPRQSSNASNSTALGSTAERLDRFHIAGPATLPSPPRSDFHRLFSGDAMPEYASLFQPNPLSILHLPSPANPTTISDDILVAGRFPSILHYDRRSFPRLTHTIYSGARLSSLSSLPYTPRLPMQPPGMSSPSSSDSSTSTLIAAGEYNGRGSLEIYTFPPNPTSSAFHPTQSFHSPTTPPPSPPPLSSYKNRQTTSASKLLSCVPHGTRILFSDADGGLKWVERDGHTLVRRWNINAFTSTSPRTSSSRSARHDPSGRTITHPRPIPPRPYDFDTAEMNARYLSRTPMEFAPVGADVVRKIIPANTKGVDNDRLILWTGEKVAAMRFRRESEWAWDGDGDEWGEGDGGLGEDVGRRRRGQEVVYEIMMRRALERQADEVRWLGGLGLG
jgi:hypothetical protein